MLPVMAPDRVLCTVGHGTRARIAEDKPIPHFAPNAGRRSKRRRRSHRINTVSALTVCFRTCTQPFRGPAHKTLAACGR